MPLQAALLGLATAPTAAASAATATEGADAAPGAGARDRAAVVTTTVEGFDAIDAARCNFLGVDTSPHSVAYGAGIAERWGLGGRVAFAALDAESALRRIVGRCVVPRAHTYIRATTCRHARSGLA